MINFLKICFSNHAVSPSCKLLSCACFQAVELYLKRPLDQELLYRKRHPSEIRKTVNVLRDCECLIISVYLHVDVALSQVFIFHWTEAQTEAQAEIQKKTVHI